MAGDVGQHQIEPRVVGGVVVAVAADHLGRAAGRRDARSLERRRGLWQQASLQLGPERQLAAELRGLEAVLHPQAQAERLGDLGGHVAQKLHVARMPQRGRPQQRQHAERLGAFAKRHPNAARVAVGGRHRLGRRLGGIRLVGGLREARHPAPCAPAVGEEGHVVGPLHAGQLAHGHLGGGLHVHHVLKQPRQIRQEVGLFPGRGERVREVVERVARLAESRERLGQRAAEGLALAGPEGQVGDRLPVDHHRVPDPVGRWRPGLQERLAVGGVQPERHPGGLHQGHQPAHQVVRAQQVMGGHGMALQQSALRIRTTGGQPSSRPAIMPHAYYSHFLEVSSPAIPISSANRQGNRDVSIGEFPRPINSLALLSVDMRKRPFL
ncbi:hypothetical protein D3C72_778480 [compost metagenome]